MKAKRNVLGSAAASNFAAFILGYEENKENALVLSANRIKNNPNVLFGFHKVKRVGAAFVFAFVEKFPETKEAFLNCEKYLSNHSKCLTRECPVFCTKIEFARDNYKIKIVLSGKLNKVMITEHFSKIFVDAPKVFSFTHSTNK
jgi:hypothetical protein